MTPRHTIFLILHVFCKAFFQRLGESFKKTYFLKLQNISLTSKMKTTKH
jgi:hypothetical protein